MLNQEVSITVGEAEAVSGVLCVPAGFLIGGTTSVIVAHGAGNDREHPLIVTISEGLAKANLVALRFNFPYRERGHRAPDPQNVLALTWESVYRFLKADPRYGTGEIVAAGKSMGGRVASQMVADGLLAATRLIFLGYPLHPPGRKEKMRDAHLYRIKIPMLFFVGSRDPLCDLTQLEGVLARLQVPARLEIIEGGDHSFRLRRSAHTPQQEVYDYILHQTVKWLRHQYGQSNSV